MDELLKQLGALNAAIIAANAVATGDRPFEAWDWHKIERQASICGQLALTVPQDAGARHVVKVALPAQEQVAFAVGRLARFLRDRGVIFQ